MQIKHVGRLLAFSTSLLFTFAAAGQSSDGALLTFKVSSEAQPEAGATQRASIEGSVLVAFNEKFAVHARSFRVELTAASEVSAAGVTIALFDARSVPPVLVGTQRVNVPITGSNTALMIGADGTKYAVAVQFKPAQLPVAKP